MPNNHESRIAQLEAEHRAVRAKRDRLQAVVDELVKVFCIFTYVGDGGQYDPLVADNTFLPRQDAPTAYAYVYVYLREREGK